MNFILTPTYINASLQLSMYFSHLFRKKGRAGSTAIDKCRDSFSGFRDQNTVNCFMERRLQEIIVVK